MAGPTRCFEQLWSLHAQPGCPGGGRCQQDQPVAVNIGDLEALGKSRVDRAGQQPLQLLQQPGTLQQAAQRRALVRQDFGRA